MPANIWFTQYLRPDGRKKLVKIERPDNVVAVADKIISHGFKFECEELATSDISLTIADPQQGEDVAIEVCPNGPDVAATVDKLILGFNLPNALKQRENKGPRS
jgi:hypothetical protein